MEKIGVDKLRNMEKELLKKSFMADIPRYDFFEGNKISSENFDGEIDEQFFEKFEKEIIIKRDELLKKGLQVFEEKSQDAVKELVEEEKRSMLKTFSEAAEKVGNVTKSTTDSFKDAFLKMLEKISLDFDEFGNPNPLTIIVSPRMREKINQEPITPEFERNVYQIIEKKRKEWIDRESHRKLVD